MRYKAGYGGKGDDKTGGGYRTLGGKAQRQEHGRDQKTAAQAQQPADITVETAQPQAEPEAPVWRLCLGGLPRVRFQTLEAGQRGKGRKQNQQRVARHKAHAPGFAGLVLKGLVEGVG